MHFVVGLNEAYEGAKSQILIMEPLPYINKAYSTVLRVEKMIDQEDLSD